MQILFNEKYFFLSKIAWFYIKIKIKIVLNFKKFSGAKKNFQNSFLSFLIFFSFFSPVINSDFIWIWGKNIVYAAWKTTLETESIRSTENENTLLKEGETLERKSSELELKANEFQKSLVSLMMAILMPLTLFTLWIIKLIWYLLHPATILDPAITPILKSYWELLKNITLTVSVFILIWIALKNLFKWWTIWELWWNIWKFAIALILINFSWFAVKFVIDVWAIATRASFTLYEDFWKSAAFTTQWYQMNWSPIINWRPDSKEESRKDVEKYKNTVCFLYPDWAAKNACDKLEDWVCSEDKIKCNFLKKDWSFWTSDSITPSNSKVVIRLTKICKTESIALWQECKELVSPNYDLPSAVLMNFIPIQEFYKISAWTEDWSTLITETLFSMWLSLVAVFSVLAILIVLIQRLAILWFFLVASPIYFFEYLIWLLWAWKFFSDKIPPSMLLSQAIFVPVWFWILYVWIALLWWELFYNNLLASWIADYTNDSSWATDWLWSIYQLIIWAWVVFWMWKWTAAIAKSAWWLGESVVNTSMNFISTQAWNYLKNSAMNTKLFTTWWSWATDWWKVSIADHLSTIKDKIETGKMTEQEKYEKWKKLKDTFNVKNEITKNIEVALDINNKDKDSFNNHMNKKVFDDSNKNVREDFVNYMKNIDSVNQIDFNHKTIQSYINELWKKGVSKEAAYHAISAEIWTNAEWALTKNLDKNEVAYIFQKLRWVNNAFTLSKSDITNIKGNKGKETEILSTLDPLLKSSKLPDDKQSEFIRELTEKWITEKRLKDYYKLEDEDIEKIENAKNTTKSLEDIKKILQDIKK